jgi:Protein of unknown function (DUF4236)
MGWGYRKSFGFGPFRINLSKSGVGYSIGVRGFRIGQDAKGRRYRTMSIPHTGIYRRDYFPKKNVRPPNSNNTPTKSVMPVSNGVTSTGRSRWAFYIGGAILLYAAIRAIF